MVFGTHERPDQINQQQQRNRPAQIQIEHGSDPIAQGDIGNHEQDTARAQDNHRDIEHSFGTFPA